MKLFRFKGTHGQNRSWVHLQLSWCKTNVQLLNLYLVVSNLYLLMSADVFFYRCTGVTPYVFARMCIACQY